MTDAATSTPAISASFVQARGTINSQLSTLGSCGEETIERIDPLRTQADAILDSLEAESRLDAPAEAAALKGIVEALASHLCANWSDQCAAQAVFLVDGHLRKNPSSLRYIADNIGTWLSCHVDDPEKFYYCLQVSPPAGIAIESVLNAGAQKQVFIARWPEVTPHKVAFKRFHDPEGTESGDAFSHPLRGHHPNIIETFPLGNAGDEVFLVERLLSTTLHYGWNFRGVGEIVNLVRDIAHALSFVHSYNRIHGDVKLENIGFEDLYILLDFGLCRSEPIDTCAWTPTGNVRALAPELLGGNANTSKSDVWALGSVAFAALTGQPPFFKPDEKQHGFIGAERDRILEKLAKRAEDPAWQRDNDRRLSTAVPELELRQLVGEMLAFEPEQRPTARKAFERCNKCLVQFLRPVQTTVQAAPEEELKSLLYLQDSGGLSLTGKSQRIALGDAAKRIDANQLKEDVDRIRLSELKAAIESL